MKPKLTPLRIVVLYALIGGLWILFFDSALTMMVKDPEVFTRVSIIKGWVYVAVTACLLYWLISRFALEQKKAEKAGENIFGRILNSMSDAMVALDMNWRYTYVNRKAAAMFGRKQEDLLGKHIWTEFPEGIDQPFYKAYYRAAETQQFAQLEEYYPPYDRWFENRIYPSPDGISIFFTDITERKKTEQALQESGRYNRLLFESAIIGLSLCRMDGALIDVNEAFAKIIGRTVEETLGLSYWEITPERYAEQEQQQLLSLKSIGNYGPYEKEYIHKDRHLVPVRLQGLVIERGGEQFIWSSVEDITERKRMERLLASEKQELEMISQGATLPKVLEKIVLSIESLSLETIASILLLDADGRHVHYGAAPNLPEAYNRAIEGSEIGPSAGSCGTAAYRKAPVIVSDIETDPLWADYRELARAHGLRACWSTPIISSEGKVLGTFAMYYQTPRSPREEDFRLIARATHTAQIAIERKRAEEALQRDEKIRRLFVDHSPAAIAMLDRDMKYLVASRRFLADYELGEQDIIGRSHYEVFPEMPERWKDIHRRCLAGAIERSEEDPFPRADGRLDWVRWEIRPWYETKSEIGGIILFSEVITERKQAEEALREGAQRLKAAVMAAKVGLWNWDLTTNKVFFSPEWKAQIGFEEHEISNDFSEWENRVHPDDLAGALHTVQSFVAEPKHPFSNEFRLRHKDGTYRWILAQGSLLFDKTGKPVRMLGSHIDITEMKHLKDLDRLKSMFIASMSHELRTPLNAVIGFSSILLKRWKGPLNDDQQLMLSTVLRSGKHLLALINDVIDVSKVEAGKIDVQREDFDLFDIIGEAAELIKKDVVDKGLELQVEPIHLSMKTDRRRLLQCVLNLLSNAVKFTPKGRVRIAARIEPVIGKPETVVIVIEDTGIGIKQEDLPMLFQAFKRLDSPLRATVLGTGLGLYLTRKLVSEVFKGDITAASEFEKGSRFMLTIPLGEDKS